MSLELPDLVQKSTPVVIESIFVIVIGLLLVANTTITDIVFHDNYVLPQIASCPKEVQDDLCTKIRTDMELPSEAQIEIGNIYWRELARQAVFLGFIMFVVRIGIGYYLQMQLRKRVRTSTILMAVFWGLIGSGFFIFGFLDTFYFWFQGEPVPESGLSWLNNAGVFTESKSWYGDPELVEIQDLYLTNIVGFVLISLFIVTMMYIYSNSGFNHRNIA